MVTEDTSTYSISLAFWGSEYLTYPLSGLMSPQWIPAYPPRLLGGSELDKHTLLFRTKRKRLREKHCVLSPLPKTYLQSLHFLSEKLLLPL